MCKWDNTIILRVPIPARLSHDGRFRWDSKPIDRCLAPAIEALNSAGFLTAGCCCGHGHAAASITFHDGTQITAATSECCGRSSL